MKYRFYVNIPPNLNPAVYNLCASTNVGEKPKGWKRVAFDVQIPDKVLFDIDAVSPEVSAAELVADHGDQA